MKRLFLTLLLCCCADYGLDRRAFLCETNEDCGDGWFCGAAGTCIRPGQPDASGGAADAHAIDGSATVDAVADASSSELCTNGSDDDGDGDVDCLDADCGPMPCDDDNVCTNDTCLGDGSCDQDPLTGSSCGTGCMCQGGNPQETSCGDGADNDGDDLRDCFDPDCPACSGGTMCCPNGVCSAVCP
jgi:hypothetical protein